MLGSGKANGCDRLLKAGTVRSRTTTVRRRNRKSVGPPSDCLGAALPAGLGLNESPPSGSFRASSRRCPPSGDESSRTAVTSRPKPALRIFPELPDAHPRLFAFRIHEAAGRDHQQPATSGSSRAAREYGLGTYANDRCPGPTSKASVPQVGPVRSLSTDRCVTCFDGPSADCQGFRLRQGGHHLRHARATRAAIPRAMVGRHRLADAAPARSSMGLAIIARLAL